MDGDFVCDWNIEIFSYTLSDKNRESKNARWLLCVYLTMCRDNAWRYLLYQIVYCGNGRVFDDFHEAAPTLAIVMTLQPVRLNLLLRWASCRRSPVFCTRPKSAAPRHFSVRGSAHWANSSVPGQLKSSKFFRRGQKCKESPIIPHLLWVVFSDCYGLSRCLSRLSIARRDRSHWHSLRLEEAIILPAGSLPETESRVLGFQKRCLSAGPPCVLVSMHQILFCNYGRTVSVTGILLWRATEGFFVKCARCTLSWPDGASSVARCHLKRTPHGIKHEILSHAANLQYEMSSRLCLSHVRSVAAGGPGQKRSHRQEHSPGRLRRGGGAWEEGHGVRFPLGLARCFHVIPVSRQSHDGIAIDATTRSLCLKSVSWRTSPRSRCQSPVRSRISLCFR